MNSGPKYSLTFLSLAVSRPCSRVTTAFRSPSPRRRPPLHGDLLTICLLGISKSVIRMPKALFFLSMLPNIMRSNPNMLPISVTQRGSRQCAGNFCFVWPTATSRSFAGKPCRNPCRRGFFQIGVDRGDRAFVHSRGFKMQDADTDFRMRRILRRKH